MKGELPDVDVCQCHLYPHDKIEVRNIDRKNFVLNRSSQSAWFKIQCQAFYNSKCNEEVNMVAEQKEILKSLAIKLHEIDAIKFGNFKLKSGLPTPIYFDLRVIIAHPDVMVSVNNMR